ncbi:MAG: tetratricopeptide repeat protein, partial [Muribaculaceae bacterium]
MTIKEITALRRSGHLTEAMAAAEAEFANAANKYTANALFWCLNDLLKQQSGNDVTATIERMKVLYNEFGSDNDYMQKSMILAEKHIVPHYYELKTAVENAKNGGDAITSHKQISIFYNNGELDKQLYEDFGWLTYYALKQTNLNEVKNRKILLSLYLQLNLSKPSILHSLILSEAVKIEKNTPLQFRIRNFVRLWELENLRNDDWEQFSTDGGNTMSSLVEKLISVYAKEVKTDHVEAPDEFCQLVDEALEKFPGNQNLPLYKAGVLISRGKIDEALSYYKDMILQSPSKFFLWDQASSLVQDIDTKIGLLCKALTCGVEDNFIVNVRLTLAKLLIQA